MEIGFAAHGGNADAIAIAANARNDALHQMLHLGMVWPPETQRIHVRNRPGAHGEHIAQDPANTRGRALVGFDIRWVVVRFHFEDRRQFGAVWSLANVNDTGILARPANDPGGFSRQFLQMDTRRFVGAMLRPHHRKYAKLNHIGLAPHGEQNARIFFFI